MKRATASMLWKPHPQVRALLASALLLCASDAVVLAQAAERPTVNGAAEPARQPDSDLVVLRSGELLRGEIQNQALTLRTAYGPILLPYPKIARLEMAAEPDRLDSVTTVIGDSFTGLLEDPWLLFAPRGSDSVKVRKERVLKVLGRVRPEEHRQVARGQLIRLRNGDSFTGRLLLDPLKITTPQAEQALPLAEVHSIQFTAEPQAGLRILLTNRTTLEGKLPGEDLEVELDAGPRLRIYQGSFDTVRTRQTSSGQPTAGGRPASLAPPPGPSPAGMVWIPPGTFLMGSPPEEVGRDFDEGPQTEVSLTLGFWMGVTEVTQAEYKAMMGINPSTFVEDPQRPVEKVTWREAMDYCGRLTRAAREKGLLPAGFAYRLPTEAEWEYACRAGTTSRFYYGEDPEYHKLADYAWFGENSDSTTHPVGTRKPNAWGLHDLHGNVLEWCLDSATSTLPGGKVTDWRAPNEGSLRIARGGSWLYGAKACRSANRDTYGELTRCSDVGFRVVLAPE